MSIRVDLSPLKRRRTKIVATIGPASSDTTTIEDLIKAGVDVFRLNMSHGQHSDHEVAYRTIREVADRVGKDVAILADLCGPKIRTGVFEDGSIELENGSAVTVTTRDVSGQAGLIPSQYENLASDVVVGSRILMDDGNLELKVDAIDGTEIACTVVVGGTLKNRKGMNLPGVNVSAPSLTEKDKVDAKFALGLGVDFLALSFVRKAADVVELRDLVSEAGEETAIVSKIEKPEALDAIDEIISVSDAIMVARGDLGVELPAEQVPRAQSQLIDRARNAGIPVIVATQMLESMIEHPRPTRAEVSDIATAVWSGADAVMLSAETAAGKFPVESVEMMDRVARDAEGHQWSNETIEATAGDADDLSVEHAVASATAGLSRDLMVRAIVVFSRTGRSALMASAWRPQSPIIVASANVDTRRRLMLSWGAVPMPCEEIEVSAFASNARRISRELGLAEDGDYILQVTGFSTDPATSEPSVTVLRV